MTSIANAIIAYGFLKYPMKGNTYPLGFMFLFSVCADLLIATVIMAGLK